MNDSATWTPPVPPPNWPRVGAGLTAFAGPSLVNAYPHIDAAQQALQDAEPQAWHGSGASRYTSLRTMDLAQVRSLRTALDEAEAALALYHQTRELMATALCPAGGTGLGSVAIPYGAVSSDALSYAAGPYVAGRRAGS